MPDLQSKAFYVQSFLVVLLFFFSLCDYFGLAVLLLLLFPTLVFLPVESSLLLHSKVVIRWCIHLDQAASTEPGKLLVHRRLFLGRL